MCNCAILFWLTPSFLALLRRLHLRRLRIHLPSGDLGPRPVAVIAQFCVVFIVDLAHDQVLAALFPPFLLQTKFLHFVKCTNLVQVITLYTMSYLVQVITLYLTSI